MAYQQAVGYACPWDVLGDPGFPGRLAKMGIEDIALAATYHAVCAATPRHPAYRVVGASYAARTGRCARRPAAVST